MPLNGKEQIGFSRNLLSSSKAKTHPYIKADDDYDKSKGEIFNFILYFSHLFSL